MTGIPPSPSLLRSRALPFLLALVTIAGCGDPPSPSSDTSETVAVDVGGSKLIVGDARRPRMILLILIDTLRADHVGALDAKYQLTPRLDELAATGTLFRQAIAPSSWTRASIAALVSGRYPTAVACMGRNDRLPQEVLTLAEALSVYLGYRTFGVYANGNVAGELGFAQGFELYETPDDTFLTGYDGDLKVQPAEGVTAAALDRVDRWRGEEGDAGAPLFLYAHYIDPHDPYLPHPTDWSPDDEASQAAGRFNGSRTDLERMRKTSPRDVTAEDRERIRSLYRGEVRHCDASIGRLLDGIGERLGSLDDVMVVVTSDHGEGLWDHGRRTHGIDLFEEQIHIPLIIKPDRRVAPQVIDAPVNLVDIAPTLLGWSGAPPIASHQGRDLSGWLDASSRPESESLRHPSFSELDLDGAEFQTVRTPRDKLIRNLSLPLEHEYGFVRFDLERDPIERENRFDGASALDRGLRNQLDGYVESNARAIVGRSTLTTSELDAETEANLRALGYLGGDDR